MIPARRSWLALSLVALALGASAIGVRNGFTYDDRYVIQMNDAVHHVGRIWKVFVSSYWPPLWGGDGYRPFTMAAFAVEWAAGGGAPWVFHAVNILLYVATTLGVFALSLLMLPEWPAWIAAALFAVHPVHVEAVANVVGQSELWVGCATVFAVFLYIRARRRGALGAGTGLALVALYAVACMAKEHGIVLPGLFAVAELLLIDDTRSLRVRFIELRPLVLALMLVAVAFLAERSVVLSAKGAGGFRPFIGFEALRIGNIDRILTMLNIVPEWIRLLVWPARLASEYAPREVEIAQGLSISQLPGFLLLAATLGLAASLRRVAPVVAAGIAWICLSLLPSSNLILPAGIILAERTLFLPSVGAMLIVGAVLQMSTLRVGAPLGRRAALLTGGAVLVVLALGTARSARRTPVWHDNDRLFHQAVIDAPNDYRAHYMLGAHYFETKRGTEGEREYRRALELFPYDPYIAFNLAEQYRGKGLCKPALGLYEWALRVEPEFNVGHTEYAWCLLNEEKYDEAKARALIALGRHGNVRRLHAIIFTADSAKAADAAAADTARRKKLAGNVPETMQKAGAAAATKGSK
jgi:protein O-mannosyl-transferase